MLVYPSGIDVSTSTLRYLSACLRTRRQERGTRWRRKGYRGAGGTVRVPYWGRWETLPTGQQAVNRSHARIRALVEQAMATLKTWRLLRKLRCSTTRITRLVQAVLRLHLTCSN